MYATKIPMVLPEQAAALGIPVELPPSHARRQKARRPAPLVEDLKAIAIVALLLLVPALVSEILGCGR